MRSGSLAAPWLVCAAVLLSFGCTRTLDFDALSTESTSDPTGSAPDDGSDAGLADGGRGATADAPVGLDGGFSCRGMSPAPAFCDDFDTVPLDDRWDLVATDPADGGTLAHDGDDALSPTNSLLATVQPGIAAQTYVGVAVRRGFAELDGAALARRARIDISFDMKVEQFDPKPGRDIVAFQLLFGSVEAQRNQLVLDLQTSGTQLRTRFNENLLGVDGTAPVGVLHDLRPQPAVGRWTHVSFELDIDRSGTQASGATSSERKNHARMRIGPHDRFDTEAVTLFDGLLAYPLEPGRPQMEIGIPWLSTDEATAAWRIRYDNVLVRISFK